MFWVISTCTSVIEWTFTFHSLYDFLEFDCDNHGSDADTIMTCTCRYFNHSKCVNIAIDVCMCYVSSLSREDKTR